MRFPAAVAALVLSAQLSGQSVTSSFSFESSMEGWEIDTAMGTFPCWFLFNRLSGVPAGEIGRTGSPPSGAPPSRHSTDSIPSKSLSMVRTIRATRGSSGRFQPSSAHATTWGFTSTSPPFREKSMRGRSSPMPEPEGRQTISQRFTGLHRPSESGQIRLLQGGDRGRFGLHLGRGRVVGYLGNGKNLLSRQRDGNHRPGVSLAVQLLYWPARFAVVRRVRRSRSRLGNRPELIPAGGGPSGPGSISVIAANGTDLILDINGYLLRAVKQWDEDCALLRYLYE